MPPGPASAERIAQPCRFPLADHVIRWSAVWKFGRGENSKTLEVGIWDSGIPMFPTSSNRNCTWGGSYINDDHILTLSCCIQAALHQPNVSHLDHLLLISSRMFHQDISSDYPIRIISFLELIKVANQQDPRTSRSMPNLIPLLFSIIFPSNIHHSMVPSGND